MAKHDAVDQLMALATQRRTDRIVDEAPTVPTALDSAVAPNRARPALSAVASSPNDAASRQGPGAGARGRQFLESVRPLLPAVAGAMRLVDHGAVQALARLLPLLGGAAGKAATAPGTAPEQEPWSRALAELQAAHQASRRDVDALTLQLAASDDLLGRTRFQLERLSAEQASRESELHALADRVRFLSAGLIILLMLIVALMILSIVVLRR